MTLNPAFPEPQSYSSKGSPRPPTANQGTRGTRREFPFEGKSRSCGIRKGYGRIPESEKSSYIRNSDEPGTKTVVPQVDTASHGVETPKIIDYHLK